MKLIIDAGASHSRWVITDAKKTLDDQRLRGVNLTSHEDSIHVIQEYQSVYSKDVREVHFYGAGMSTASIRSFAKGVFLQKFPSAKILIESDILAACRATSHNEASIVSILGTGVNTVLYKENKIKQSIKSLGHIIAEEGSGYNIGRLIVKYYLRERMSAEDALLFKAEYLTYGEELISNIYGHSNPKYYVAQFSRFLNQSSTTLKKEILSKNFMGYVKNHVSAIENYQNYKINFVGSIANRFQQELNSVLREYDMVANHIIDDPMEKLIDYHRQEINNE